MILTLKLKYLIFYLIYELVRICDSLIGHAISEDDHVIVVGGAKEMGKRWLYTNFNNLL